MKDFDVRHRLTELEYDICDTQGKVYEQVAKDGYDVEWFSNGFLRSDFCRREMDESYSRFQYSFPEESLDYAYPEIEESLRRPSVAASPLDAYNTGWLYRYLYLYLNREVPSESLANRYPYKLVSAMATEMSWEDDYRIAEKIIRGQYRRDLGEPER